MVVIVIGGCNISWNLQPIQDTLSCDLLGVDITLECTAFPASLLVSWFWTRNVSQAGITGTQILEGMGPHTVTGFVPGYKKLLFLVNESTVGYYWCEITDAGVNVRPSSIVPVCSDSSLPQCPNPYENYPHNVNSECAVQDANFTVSHSGLPTDCAVPPSPSTILGLISHNSFQTSPVLSTIVLPLESAISPSSVAEFPVTMTSKSASSIAEFPSVTQTRSLAIVSCHSSNLPLISNDSLPWVLAVAGLGVALLFVISMLAFSVFINCKQNKTIALLRTQNLGEIFGQLWLFYMYFNDKY